jgi:two-component system, OmpR family, sensor histidine kinase MprB
MPLRRRISLVAAAAVGIAVVLATGIAYLVVREQLRGTVDSALKAQAGAVQTSGFRALGQPFPSIPASAGGPAPYVQIVGQDGSTAKVSGNLSLPVDAHTLAAANGGSNTYLGDIWVDGNHLRELILPATLSAGDGQTQTVAIQLARPLGPTDHILSELRLILLLVLLGGIALAAALGRVAARRVLAPLSEVTQTAEHIGETDDLSARLVVHADDEVGQLARRFNEMLERLQGSRAALDESVRAQRQLVADASHELRTPVTSLRTNIEVLLADPGLDDEERQRLLADVVEQSEELTGLVGDLIELARGDLPLGSAEDTRLDRIVEEAVARARRNSPGIHFETDLAPVTLEGVPERLGRAVNNLLDNAARHSPPGGTVEVVVDAGGVRVRDHGPGIDQQDLPQVFDRFFRGINARGTQGSGLGLAIVRQVTEQHGGTASVANAPDGGAIFTLHLPTSPADQPRTPAAAHAHL